MFFKRKDHLVGLDIGSGSIKAAELEPTKKGWVLKRFGISPLPRGAIEEGSIKEPDLIADQIRSLFSGSKIKETNVALSIGGYSVIVKNISMPAVPEEELGERITMEAEQYVPYDIKDVNLDYIVLGENEKNPNQINVLLIAAKRELVEDYVNLAGLADLVPCIVDVDAFALQNIFELSHGLDDDSVALIDIGSSKTSLNILRGGTSVFIRDVALGCNQINDRIAQAVGVTPEEAEEIKLQKASDRISSEAIEEIELSVIELWCSEIRRAIDFFYSTYPEDSLARIFLSGGGANIKKFRYSLAAETSVEVNAFDPFAGLLVDEGRFDITHLRRVAPQASICLGLALRRVNDK